MESGCSLIADSFRETTNLASATGAPLPIDLKSIDNIVLTHAHLDHSGWLPRIAKQGYTGPIYSNAATRELCAILLADSGRIQEEDAYHAAKHGYSSHKPPLPLYTEADALKVMNQFKENPRTGPFQLSPEFTLKQHDAGHILGSASLELTITENGHNTVVLFSGDIGRYDQPILNDPEVPPRADVVLCESTYGDRIHPATSALDELADAVNRVSKRGGVLVVPAFAVGRTQLMMYLLRELEDAGRVPRIPVYIDSPMAISVTSLYLAHREDHDAVFPEGRDRRRSSRRALGPHDAHARSIEADQSGEHAVHHCVGQRHGYRRPRAASLDAEIARREKCGAAGGLSSGRNFGPRTTRRSKNRAHLWTERARDGGDHQHGPAIRARRAG